ncbi:protein Red [Drosophila grimshawi]|uniref:GH18236 n=1 Tax=Drosophila grimshawi TaxID=7222 RepID=B4JFM4_DROGR|nr:protein Red [Drosophila grimshawi]EDV93505.1 GH18236 [Drosophila grimshawi]
MSEAHLEAPPSVRLTNDDFRKLLATPRTPTPSSSSSSATGGGVGGVVGAGSGYLATAQFATPATPGEKKKSSSGSSSSERNDLRRKKKNFYAALKKQEDVKLQELSEKYRDRARERRDNVNPDYQNPSSTPGHGSNTNAYRAVAPDMKSGVDAAERRRRIIQESKFLGGDMKHTHLVKGLDYALLQKVRSELHSKEAEEEELAAALAREKLAEAAAAAQQLEAERREAEDINAINGALARNIYNLIQARRSKEVPRNELFAPGRMAYVIDMEDEMEMDIPTTLKRSKYEVPVAREDIATLTTNDIVINKLSQILSYLRAGGRNKKNKKRDKDKPLFYDKEVEHVRGQTAAGGAGGGGGAAAGNSSSGNSGSKSSKAAGDNIYDDVGDYQPTMQPRNERHQSKSINQSGSGAPQSYFGDAPAEVAEPVITSIPPPPKISKAMASRFANEPEGYAECYPGLEEMNDAIDDSDDEVDYTKMDLGNKKGPIGRWDFDTQEEYSDYMSTKEALPKAAFQYGVKMQDGRKTRKNKTEKNEKAELDREWQKIQTIIQKRKLPKDGGGGGAGGGGGSGAGGGDEPDYKSAKY